MHILAIDVGTSSVKAAVLDVETAAPVGEIARKDYQLDHPTSESAEIPPERLWACFVETSRQAVWNARSSKRDIEGVGLSSLTPALVLLDKSNKPLKPIWTHLDRRARPAARQVWRTVGKDFLNSTGNRPLPGGISVISLRQQLKDDSYLLHDIHSYLHLNGWLGFCLTGEKVFDPGNASFTGLFETLTSHEWSVKWCDFFEVNPNWLPRIVSGEKTIGTLRSEVASEMALPAGIPVKVGVPDTSSAMLAVGMQKQDLMHVVGTTQVLSVFVDEPVPTPHRLTRHLGLGDQMVQVTHNPLGGVALNWIYDLCFRDQSKQEFFEKTLWEAVKLPTRVTLDPPFLGGDRLQIEAHRAAFRDLTISTNRMELLSSVLNEMIRRHRDALRALGKKEPFRRIFLTGGGCEVIRKLIPEYKEAAVETFEEGSLMGVAALFRNV